MGEILKGVAIFFSAVGESNCHDGYNVFGKIFKISTNLPHLSHPASSGPDPSAPGEAVGSPSQLGSECILPGTKEEEKQQ